MRVEFALRTAVLAAVPVRRTTGRHCRIALPIEAARVEFIAATNMKLEGQFCSTSGGTLRQAIGLVLDGRSN
jgi:hypothetical protein